MNDIYLWCVSAVTAIVAINTVWRLVIERERLWKDDLTDEDRAFAWRLVVFLVFPLINLLDLRKTAKAANVQPLRVGVATLIAIELAKHLGPSRPPKVPKPPRIKAVPKPPRSLTRIPVIEANVALGMKLLDLNRKLCPAGTFTWTVDGVQVRSDGVHLTPTGVRWLTPWLLRALPRA